MTLIRTCTSNRSTGSRALWAARPYYRPRSSTYPACSPATIGGGAHGNLCHRGVHVQGIYRSLSISGGADEGGLQVIQNELGKVVE